MSKVTCPRCLLEVNKEATYNDFDTMVCLNCALVSLNTKPNEKPEIECKHCYTKTAGIPSSSPGITICHNCNSDINFPTDYVSTETIEYCKICHITMTNDLGLSNTNCNGKCYNCVDRSEDNPVRESSVIWQEDESASKPIIPEITLRQYYAGLAMQALILNRLGSGRNAIADNAFLYADAMIQKEVNEN